MDYHKGSKKGKRNRGRLSKAEFLKKKEKVAKNVNNTNKDSKLPVSEPKTIKVDTLKGPSEDVKEVLNTDHEVTK